VLVAARSGVPAVGPRCDRPVGLSDRRLRYLACTAGRRRAPWPPERVNRLLSVREQRQVRPRGDPDPLDGRSGACRPMSGAGWEGTVRSPRRHSPTPQGSVEGLDQPIQFPAAS